MATFLLVHGAWQAGWVWRELMPLLGARGHRSLAPDLPGHGADTTPLEEITLQHYVDALVRIIDALEAPPIVVGHSMAGLVARVGGLVPDRVSALVYVAAIVPPSGKAMFEAVSAADPEYLATFVWSEDQRTARISADGARRFLYPLVPPAQVEEILPLLTPEPAGPFQEPIQISPERLSGVPAYYIECLRDRIIPLSVQREMQANVPLRRTYSIDTDHSPFFSAPDQLAAHLHAIAVECAPATG